MYLKFSIYQSQNKNCRNYLQDGFSILVTFLIET